MHTRHAVDPGCRHVALRERKLHLIKRVQVHLIAAQALGLQHAKQAGLLHLRNGFVRNAAPAPCRLGARGKRRDHRARPRDDLVRAGHAYHAILTARVPAEWSEGVFARTKREPGPRGHTHAGGPCWVPDLRSRRSKACADCVNLSAPQARARWSEPRNFPCYSAALRLLRAFCSRQAITASVDITSPKVR